MTPCCFCNTRRAPPAKRPKSGSTTTASNTARHIKEDNPTADELREWVARSGLPLKRFFNTSGLVYKNLGLKDKLPTMTEDEQIALLASDGMLVKRPLLVGDDFVLPGFKSAEWENALL